MLPARFTDAVALDSGGFATVYRARDSALGAVAVKTPKSADEDVINRFRREIELQTEFAHPNIVEVVDFDLDATPPWYAMQLAQANFASVLADSSFDLATLLGLFGDVMSGVGHAHAQHVLHRDLKPGNVLIYRDGGAPTARVSDFGLSRRFTRDRMDFQTKTAYAAGTSYYTAPEQWSDFREAAETADVFSLGRILELMLKTRVEMPNVYPQLIECVKVATRFEPLERYQTVEQLSVAVQLAVLDGAENLAAQDVISRAVQMYVEAPDDQIPRDRLMDALEKYEQDQSALRLAFARLPRAALDALCIHHPGRFRSVLLGMVQVNGEPVAVDAAMRYLDLYERCLEVAQDSRLRAVALAGMVRLAAVYGMTEFNQAALYHFYQLTDREGVAHLTSLLTHDAGALDWLSRNADPARVPPGWAVIRG